MRHLFGGVSAWAVLSVIAAATAFAEDPYLQSDGTQYIDTGYMAKSTTRVELDMQLITANTGGDQYFFGWHGAAVANSLYFGCYTAVAGKYCYNCRSDSCNWGTMQLGTSTDRRTIVLDAYSNVFKVLDASGETLKELTITTDHSTGTVDGTMPIFGSRNGGSVLGKSAFRLYGCRIYEEGELVHEFMPYRWGGAYGLRDLKTGVFRVADGTNPLTYGGDFPEGDDAYLLSDGTQFIDTLCYGKSNTCVEIDFALLTPATGGDQYIFGVHGAASTDVNPLYFGLYVNGSGYYGWNCKRGSGNWGGFGLSATTDRRQFTIDGPNEKVRVTHFNKVLCDTTFAARSGGVAPDHADAVTPMMMTVFGSRNQANAARLCTAMRLYGMRIYEGGVLTKEFVPRMKGDAPGLYETQGGTFHTDWSRTREGRLAIGGAYETMPDDPYIHGDGTLHLDTGYKAKGDTRIEVELSMDTGAYGRSRYVFGPSYTTSDKMSFCAYSAESDYYGFCCKKGGQKWDGLGQQPTVARERIVLDAAAGVAQLYVSGARMCNVKFTPDVTADDETYHTITLFCNRASGSSSPASVSGVTPMRLYSCRIFEGGTLVHEFLPFVKGSLAGMRDTKTGRFLEPRASSGATGTFDVGGEIQADVEEDAYLMSDGTQAINTGYRPGLNSRIEVDFALTRHAGYGERVFGTTAGGDLRLGLYGSGTADGWGFFYFGFGDGAVNVKDTGVAMDVRRHTATVDFLEGAGTLHFTTTNVTYTSGIWPKPTATAAWPMGLFAEPADAAFTTATNFAKMKLYSAKVYEDGVLVHHYLPYGSGAAPGLKDIVTGETFTDCMASATPFKVGGRGFGGAQAVFAVAPSNTVIGVRETATTLRAFAPGALAYQWLADGEPIAGATGETLPVTWSREGEGVEYSVRATFDRYGLEVTSDSAPVWVRRKVPGTVILFH